jgi:hypothetical protein
MTVRQTIELNIYTTRSLKREYTGRVRLARATGEGDPDTFVCDIEGDGLESDRSPMDSDTNVRNTVDDFFRTETDSLARQTAGSYPKAKSTLRS